ncbi:hypothetical protein Tco_0090130 [Tanacetum coccineum]
MAGDGVAIPYDDVRTQKRLRQDIRNAVRITEGYRNTIELPDGNNVVPLRSDTIRLVQNGCSFHGLRSEDPNQHLNDFLKLVDSLDLDGESLSEAWTRFKDLLQKLPHHGIDLWLQVQIFYDHIDQTLKRVVDYAARGWLGEISAEKAWSTIEELAQYKEEGCYDPIFPEEGSPNYENTNIEQILGIMESQVDSLMKDEISLIGKNKNVCGISSNNLGRSIK